MQTDDDRPRRRKYARVERERRFLLESLPPTVDPKDYERLRDRYIVGTHLRLRRIEDPQGELLLVKLGQKIIDPEAPRDPRRRQMTTLYLEPLEGAALGELLSSASRSSVKRRYRLAEQGWTFVIDVYEEPARAAGIQLAEVECPTDEELAAIEVPSWALRDVTDEPQWSGARLAESVTD